jgi:hypothetical protein
VYISVTSVARMRSVFGGKTSHPLNRNWCLRYSRHCDSEGCLPGMSIRRHPLSR